MDELTAFLDPKSEEEISNILNEFGKEKSVLIISHKMCSAKLANRIVLLEDGLILEDGMDFTGNKIKSTGEYNFYNGKSFEIKYDVQSTKFQVYDVE